MYTPEGIMYTPEGIMYTPEGIMYTPEGIMYTPEGIIYTHCTCQLLVLLLHISPSVQQDSRGKDIDEEPVEPSECRHTMSDIITITLTTLLRVTQEEEGL